MNPETSIVETNKDTTKTSLSNQGYAIYKNKITEKEVENIKNDLTIKPFSCPGYGNPEDIEPYKIYKENTEKIYVPSFYGRNKFGKPDKIKITEPETINIKFSSDRQMRPYQQEIIKTYITSAKEIGGGIISVGCGRGKCLAKGTIVPLYNGNSKQVEELLVGDTLIGDDGSPRIIMSLGSGISQMYEVSYEQIFKKRNTDNTDDTDDYSNTIYINNLQSYTVNEEHILTLCKTKNKKIISLGSVNTPELIDISILEYMSLSIEEQNKYKGIKVALKNLCLNYVKDKYEIKNNTQINKYILSLVDNISYVNPYNSFYIGYILGLKLVYNEYEDDECENRLFNKIETYNLEDIYNYINNYKYKLQYIVDLYVGFICNLNNIDFPINLYILENKENRENKKQKNNDTDNEIDIFTVLELVLNILSISYKISSEIEYDKHYKYLTIINDEYNNYTTMPIKITPKGQGEYYGFELSGNGRFILADRTITHNTVMGLKIAEELNVKTLILVHKEFLMNQWVERINEYLPEAKVGYIQGKTCDINRKDIVLAMIQSLSDPRKDKDYPANLFESFGLVIADECHHLAARQFCRSLAKYPFKYTLGLSATPDRADGLQRVFKHYLGDIIYKDAEIEQTEEDIKLEHIPNSNVELYIYNNPDYKYTKEELNYQKKPNIVTMKSNIANCVKRTTFLLSFLPRLIEEGRTILILSCRRNHITDMEIMINKMNIPNCSVGLYIGGMKQTDLDSSASKRVIIATYDMAEEAFDCKSLNTLIYGTPHKNIKQAVGRILREEKKKRKIIPLIIDLQDTFSSFVGWNKLREKYYKTESYPMKIFNVIDKPEMSFKPEVSFMKDVLHKGKNANEKKSSAKNKKNNSNSNNNNTITINTLLDNAHVDEVDEENENESGDDSSEKQTIIDF
jgi:superfamily II DNA or RNA helicase